MSKKKLLIILISVVGLITSINAEGNDTYKKKTILDNTIIYSVYDVNKDGKDEVIAQTKGQERLSILRWNGIWFRKIGQIKIEMPIDGIRDVAIGDVDNDGIDEIIILSRENLYVFEKKNRDFIMNNAKTVSIYEQGRYTESYITETLGLEPTDRKRGKVIVGDITNDGKNEIILSKIIGQGADSPYISIDVLSWQEESFKLINDSIWYDGSGEEGFAVVDLDDDGINELMITFASIIIEVYQYERDDFRVKAWFELGLNIGDPRTTVGMFDGAKVLIYCARYITSGPQDDVGQIRLIDLNPQIFPQLAKRKGLEIEHRHINAALLSKAELAQFIQQLKQRRKQRRTLQIPKEKFIQISETIQLPIKSYQVSPKSGLYSRKYCELQSLVVGDIDGDNKIEIIANMPAGAYIYGLKFNVALIVTIIIGVILIIALAVFLLIRRRKRKTT